MTGIVQNYTLVNDTFCPASHSLPEPWSAIIGWDGVQCGLPLSTGNVDILGKCCNITASKPLTLIRDIDHPWNPVCWATCHAAEASTGREVIQVGKEFRKCFARLRVNLHRTDNNTPNCYGGQLSSATRSAGVSFGQAALVLMMVSFWHMAGFL